METLCQAYCVFCEEQFSSIHKEIIISFKRYALKELVPIAELNLFLKGLSEPGAQVLHPKCDYILTQKCPSSPQLPQSNPFSNITCLRRIIYRQIATQQMTVLNEQDYVNLVKTQCCKTETTMQLCGQDTTLSVIMVFPTGCHQKAPPCPC